MTTSISILLFTISAFLIATVIVFAYSIKKHFKIRKEINDLTRYSINVSANIDNTVPALLELIITEAFADYQAMNQAFKSMPYINDEEENKIRKGLADMVSERISGPTLDKLSLYYNAPRLGAIIADKIYIIVTSYVVEHNRSTDEGFRSAEAFKKNLPSENILG